MKDIRNLFKLKNELNYTAIKDIINLFRWEKETKAIKDRIRRDIKNLFEYKEENYYKPVRVNNFWSNKNHIEYESNGDRNKTLLVEEYLNKIRPCLKDITNNLKISNTWKIELTTANNFISSIDSDEEHLIHSKSDHVEIMINDEAGEVIKEPFDSLKNRYKNNLESIKDSDFVLDYVHLLYYKCHKINLNRSSPYWINPMNKESKCYQYAVTVALNHDEIKKDQQRIVTIK